MKNLTADQLNNLDHEALVNMILSQQEEISKLDHTLQLFMEEVADAKRHRFGRSTESFEPDGQISFREIDGEFVFFNETEAVCDEETE